MADDATIKALLVELRPLIAEIVNASVVEALKRVVTAEPLSGTVSGIQGATAIVSVPNNSMQIPCTMLSTAIAVGSPVVIFFYGHGRAFCAGPTPLP